MLKSAKAVLSARAALHTTKMAPPLPHGSSAVDPRKPTYSPTSLKRWSCQSNGDLPGTKSPGNEIKFTRPEANLGIYTAVSQIKAIHVYDFDNTCKQAASAPY